MILKTYLRALIISAGLLLIILNVYAEEPQGYYRYPTAYGNTVVFTADGDLWSAPLSGGLASRLTTAAGVERFAMFSPDGKWIAFSGNYDGNLDVYVIPAIGGEPRRLTYHPGQDLVAAWTPDGKIVYRSRQETARGQWKCYKVSVDGDFPAEVPVDEAAHISFEPKGDRIAYTRVTLGGATWKRYKGGWAEDIYVGSLKTHDYKIVTQNDGNDATPMWYKDRIYYMRDNDARMNIHSMKPDGSDIKQHTNHADWDGRWPTLADGKIAYSLGADIWVYDIDKNEDKKIDIYLPSDRTQARDKFIKPSEYNNDFSLSPDGGRLLLVARGELFSAPSEKRGVIKQLTRTPDAREKYPIYLPKGDSILTWSDLSGEEALYLYPTGKSGEPRKVADGAGGWNFGVDISPDGKTGIYGDNEDKLYRVEISTGKTTAIDSSTGEIRNYVWSRDSRYIAYDVGLQSGYNQVRIYDTQENKVHEVTDPMWSSFGPSWDPKGKWLYFISARHVNMFTAWNDWQGHIPQDPYKICAIALDDSTTNPYALVDDAAKKKKDKDEGEDKEDDKDKKDDKKKDEKASVKIVWNGIIDRIIELPVDAGNYYNLSAIEGKLYFISALTLGNEPEGDADAPRTSLHLFDIEKQKDNTVISGANNYALSRDLKKIAVKKRSGFVIMDAGETEAPKEKDDKKKDPDKGLHLEDWVYDVDPKLEWKQIFNEAWRLQRDFFYAPNLHGVDWKAQRDHYGTLLSRLGTREELQDLIGQLIGELNAGHTYVYGGDIENSKNIGVGLLGIDVSKTSGGMYKIEKILHGDNWDKGRHSPLSDVGLNVKEGNYIVAIDHTPVNKVKNYLELLNNKSGKLIVLSVNDKPSMSGARELVVETMSDEGDLRYYDWVNSRIDYVKKKAGNDICYIHLPDMGGAGLKAWERMYYPQLDRKGLIMDDRYNHGGNIAEWVLGLLERKPWAWGAPRNGSVYRKPSTSFNGHMICLCNGETFSDGETMAEGFKRLKLGPLVGKRTWGGWVWIRGDKPFVDNGGFTEPEFGHWDKDSKWLVEGPGVSPDIDVENHPKQMMEGVDEQLDYAIKYLQDKIKSEPMSDPKRPPDPVKAGK